MRLLGIESSRTPGDSSLNTGRLQNGRSLILVQAATCGHLLGSGHLRPPLGSGHLRPLEWLQVAASGCGPVTTASGCKLAASDCKWLRACDHIGWPQVAASRCVLVVPLEQSVCLQNLKKYLFWRIRRLPACRSSLDSFLRLIPFLLPLNLSYVV